MLDLLPTGGGVGTMNNMGAIQLVNRREIVAADAFIEVVIWRLPRPTPPCDHRYKYRLAYVVREVCVIRYDNERGKGDQRHVDGREREYVFRDIEKLIEDFRADIRRWDSANRNS
jgi:hypothetical protein